MYVQQSTDSYYIVSRPDTSLCPPALIAGEFCIVPDESAAGNHRLIIDNNSGTYAPDTKHLHLMEQLFKANFKDMTVEVLAVGDPRLEFYQKQCPSRSGN